MKKKILSFPSLLLLSSLLICFCYLGSTSVMASRDSRDSRDVSISLSNSYNVVNNQEDKEDDPNNAIVSNEEVFEKEQVRHPYHFHDQQEQQESLAEVPLDILAVLPDRSTAYPNGVHNGLLLTSHNLGVRIEIQDVGNFDPTRSHFVLRQLIARQKDLPRIFLVWPIDETSRQLTKQLWLTHNIPILQMNQYPLEAGWEWDHLVGFVGPDDTLRAKNAGKMMISAAATATKAAAAKEEQQAQEEEEVFQIVALGYPETYGGYHLSIKAFEETIVASNNSTTSRTNNIRLLEKIPLDWGTQPAYEATLQLLDQYSNSGSSLDGIYAMDDVILMGAYQAIQDHPASAAKEIVLVGTVCNGARELLQTGEQYGTTIQGPYLEGDLAIRTAMEYLSNAIQQSQQQSEPIIRFTPNPIATSQNWDTMFVDYNNATYTADQLCTWDIGHYKRVAGITGDLDNLPFLTSTTGVCSMIDCQSIPTTLLFAGLIMCGINYGLALVSLVGLWWYSNAAIIQLAQPTFLVLVTLGTTVDNTSILLMSTHDNAGATTTGNNDSSDEQEQLDTICFTIPWVLALGHMMTTATLAAKMYRVKKIILGSSISPKKFVGSPGCKSGTGTGTGGQSFRSKAKKPPVTIGNVLIFILGFLAVDILLLTLWSIFDSMTWQILVSSYYDKGSNTQGDEEDGYVAQARGQCTWSTDYGFIFPLLIVMFHLETLIYANILAYQTRDYHKISDSKPVAIALFISIQLVIIVFPLLVVIGSNNVGTYYFISVCFVFLNNFSVLALLVLPKLWKCVMGHGDVMPEWMVKKAANSYSSSRFQQQRSSRISGLNNNNNNNNCYNGQGGTTPKRSRGNDDDSIESFESIYSNEQKHAQSSPLDNLKNKKKAIVSKAHHVVFASNDDNDTPCPETDDDVTPIMDEENTSNSNNNDRYDDEGGGFIPFVGTEPTIFDQFFLGSELLAKLQDEAAVTVQRNPTHQPQQPNPPPPGNGSQ